MTLPRLYALVEYWKDAPPLPEAVAALAHWAGAIKRTEVVRADSREGQAQLATILSGMQLRPLPRPA